MKRLLGLVLAALLLPPAAGHAQATASPYTSAVRYDAMSRVTGTISADPDGVGSGNPFIAVRNSYDGAGRLTKVETGTLATWQSEAVAPANWAGFSVNRTLETLYDAMNRKTRDSLREGAAGAIRSLTQYSYDSLGRLECTAVRMNPAVYGSPPASACTLGTQGSDGPDRITRNVYDAAGQRLQLREGVGTADDGTEATWAYNAGGQVTAMIDGNGNRAELRYDGHGRQDRWTFPAAARPTAYNDATPASALASAGAANANDYEGYGYDPNGNRTSLRKRDGSTLSYSYDALNRMTVKDLPGAGGDVAYGYDLRNLQLSAVFSATGQGVTNGYDGFGRLTSSTSTMGGTSRALSYRYDRNGNRIRITHPDLNRFETDYDGLNRPTLLWMNEYTAMAGMGYYAYGAPGGRSLANSSTSEWGYDAVQRPTAVVQNAAGTSADLFLSLSYNPAGQIGSRNLNNDSYVWTGHYAVTRAYTTNGRNQYTQTVSTTAAGPGSANYDYDANGNLISDGSRTYVYDVENRLVSSSNGAALSYDPLGRLWQVTLGANTTQFLYDGDALVEEYNGAGTRTRRYAHWVGSDVPLLSYAGADLSQPSYLHADQQGSIIMVSDQAGNPSINRYDEYGIPASTNVGRFQYTGQALLTELGMYYYKARFYSPTLGRFMQTDPVGYEGGINLYAYVEDDPANGTDPDGTCSETYCPGPDQLTHSVEHADISPERAQAAAEIELQATIRILTVVAQLRGGEREAGTPRSLPGIRPSPGSRTFAGQAGHAREQAGGNPTIRRGGQDLFRLRPSGHGSTEPSVRPQNVRRVDSQGRAFTGRGPDRPMTPRDMRELYKAQTRQGTNEARIRSGRPARLEESN